jgi:hypothetical protein
MDLSRSTYYDVAPLRTDDTALGATGQNCRLILSGSRGALHTCQFFASSATRDRRNPSLAKHPIFFGSVPHEEPLPPRLKNQQGHPVVHL